MFLHFSVIGNTVDLEITTSELFDYKFIIS